MKNFLTWISIPIALLLNSCYAPAIEGVQQGYDASRRSPLKAAVNASNDVVAQYQLGNTYCCKGGGPMDDLTIYDNTKATYWYCKSARHGYGPAQLQLARLYSGHAIRGLHIALRASAIVGTADTDLSVALMWANLAVKNKTDVDIDDATELRNEITDKSSSDEIVKSAAMMNHWRTADCAWSEVFPSDKSTTK